MMKLNRIYFNTEFGGGSAVENATQSTSTTAVSDSSSSSTDVKSANNSAQESTEPLKQGTDDVNEAKIPRARLNEEIAKRKELEKRMEHYEKNYKNFDSIYNSDPVFQTAINNIVVKYQNGELTQKQAQQEVEKVQDAQASGELSDDDFVSLKDVKKMIGETQAQFNERVKQDAFRQYDTLFTDDVKSFLGDNFHPREVQMLSHLVQQEMLKNNPKALDTFDASLMRQALVDAKKEYQAILDTQFARYSKQKQAMATPSVQPAPAPKDKVDFANMSDEERARYVFETMRKSKN